MTAFVIAERGKNRNRQEHVNMHDASLSCSSQTKSHEKKKKKSLNICTQSSFRALPTMHTVVWWSLSVWRFSPAAVFLNIPLMDLQQSASTVFCCYTLSRHRQLCCVSLSLSLFLNLPPKQPPPPSPFYPNPLPLCPLSVVMATRL